MANHLENNNPYASQSALNNQITFFIVKIIFFKTHFSKQL